MTYDIQQRFSQYLHSIPIVFSHLEGQYSYDTIEGDDYTVLLTPLGFHYVAGTVPTEPDAFLKLIKDYLRTHEIEEFVLFGPNEDWNAFLQTIFQQLRGIVDQRFAYRLNVERFRDRYDNHTFKHQVKLDVMVDEESTKPYLQVNIRKDDKIVSFCRAFLLGKGHAELDVFTEEAYRGQQMAYETSLYLIQALLERNIVPDWTCWRMKESSQHLADKLGYEKANTIPAYVWVSDFGLDD
jgi:hypothetical protein